MVLDNDVRGWIMTAVSGIACVAGASIICVDLLIRMIPRYRSFRIQDSNVFLSSSLSLSFGVMLFSALYSMLPSAKSYLMRGGFQSRPAAFILIACFIGGVVGISAFSKLLHRFVPSHVVGCDHSHEDAGADSMSAWETCQRDSPVDLANGYEERSISETTPLLSHSNNACKLQDAQKTQAGGQAAAIENTPPLLDAPQHRRPSLQKRLTRRLTLLVGSAKARCDERGPCHGFTDPCGQECFKVISKSPTRSVARHPAPSGPQRLLSSARRPASLMPSVVDEEAVYLDRDILANHDNVISCRHYQRSSMTFSEASDLRGSPRDDECSSLMDSTSNQAAHHHHVASNAFLSIGLQTSIAIALHKLPEGFITYATNHANPKLGFAVFMALFIHNITEGFAMALPLFLAINSRIKAMIASAFLGGVSQPLGAAIAALWLQTAQKHDMIPGEKVYGCMFAVTSGIMTAVALQLFSESLSLTHSKNLCIAFAFVGMGILGVSNALTS